MKMEGAGTNLAARVSGSLQQSGENSVDGHTCESERRFSLFHVNKSTLDCTLPYRLKVQRDLPFDQLEFLSQLG